MPEDGFKKWRMNNVPVTSEEEHALNQYNRFSHLPGNTVAVTSLCDGIAMPYPVLQMVTGVSVCRQGGVRCMWPLLSIQ